MRAVYGQQRACAVCGQDIEYHSRPRPRELVPGVTMTTGGWVDRGAGRFCLPYLDRGETVTPPRRLHQP